MWPVGKLKGKIISIRLTAFEMAILESESIARKSTKTKIVGQLIMQRCKPDILIKLPDPDWIEEPRQHRTCIRLYRQAYNRLCKEAWNLVQFRDVVDKGSRLHIIRQMIQSLLVDERFSYKPSAIRNKVTMNPLRWDPTLTAAEIEKRIMIPKQLGLYSSIPVDPRPLIERCELGKQDYYSRAVSYRDHLLRVSSW